MSDINVICRRTIMSYKYVIACSGVACLFSSFFLCFQGGVILVSHNEQLIQMVAQETWLCGNKTVKRVEGGFKAYKKTLEEEFRRINAI